MAEDQRMRLDEFRECSGIPVDKNLTCHKCEFYERVTPATIEYDIKSICDLVLCDQCAEDIALGLMRDVLAGRIGEELAQKAYVSLLDKHR